MTKSLSRRILDFMGIQPNEWFTPKNIAIPLNEITNSVSKTLSRLWEKHDIINRDILKNGFKHEYNPNFQISPAIVTEKKRGVPIKGLKGK